MESDRSENLQKIIKVKLIKFFNFCLNGLQVVKFFLSFAFRKKGSFFLSFDCIYCYKWVVTNVMMTLNVEIKKCKLRLNQNMFVIIFAKYKSAVGSHVNHTKVVFCFNEWIIFFYSKIQILEYIRVQYKLFRP